jgi:hypothetical protein
MTNYYYVTSSFPEVRIGGTTDINFRQLNLLLQDNLSKDDLEKTRVIRRLYDLYNIRSLWLKEELTLYGNYNDVELEDALIAQSVLPKYVFDYLEKYPTNDERIKHFPELIHNYFNIEIEKADGFLKKYLIFERDWRLVFAAFRAKKLGRDILEELQYEDPNRNLIAQILAQKDAKTFEPPFEYEELKPIFEANQDSPLALQQALDSYRFEKINSLLGVDMFSINRILGYMAQLILVEEWLKLDKEKGLEIVENIAKSAS